MNTKNSKGLDLVPKEPPPAEYLPEQFLASPIPAPPLGIPEESFNAFLWTMALAAVFNSRRLWRDIAGFNYAAYGFADPDFERDAFGVIVYAAPTEEAQSREEHSIEVGGHRFPMFVRRPIEEYHATPSEHPSKGTAACWARSQKVRLSRSVGFVTAAHVLPSQKIGSRVRTTRGHGTVLDVGPGGQYGIDAALVEPAPGAKPTLTTQLTLLNLIALWIDVTLVGASGQITTKVVQTTDTRGILHHPSIPARVFIASPGQAGDSGGLVKDASNRGVGLYMGALTDPSGQTTGFCQHLGQAAHVMNLTLYA